MEREVEALKAQLEHNKKEALQAEEQYKETMHHWQTKVWFLKIYLFNSFCTEKNYTRLED